MAAMDLTIYVYINDTSNPLSFTVQITPTEDLLVYAVGGIFNFPSFIGPLNTATNTFPTYSDAVTYYLTQYGNDILGYIDSIAGTMGSTLGTIHNNLYESNLDALSLKVDKTTTVNGHALSGNVSVTAADVGAPSGSGTSTGTNTGDQNLSGLATKTTTVNGHALSTNVTVTAGDVGLGNVDNTSDANKPVSSATQTALNGKQATLTTGTTAQYFRGDLSLATFPSIPSVARTSSAFTLNVSGTGATGTQVSSTNNSTVRLTYSTQVTYSLSGSPASNVTVKICSTNSATESDWTDYGQTETAQPTGLAVTVGQVVRQKGQICVDVPLGWYVKALNSGTGTHTEAFVSGQKTIYG